MPIICLLIPIIILTHFGSYGPSTCMIQDTCEGVLSPIYIVDPFPISLSFWDLVVSHHFASKLASSRAVLNKEELGEWIDGGVRPKNNTKV